MVPLVLDAEMPSSEIPRKSKGFEEIVLGIVVGLFLPLGVAYLAYPAFCYHHLPRPMWPIHPVTSSGRAASPSLAYFFFAALTASFGFWQTRVNRWFGRESSRILLWLFSLFSLVVIAGNMPLPFAVAHSPPSMNCTPPCLHACEVGPAVEYRGGVVELRICAISQASRLGICCYLASEPQTLQKAFWNP
jgi:hypothetical protein